jgi:5-hydroxyisourate hydrolase
MSTCSTHVLDAALGRPAAGVPVALSTAAGIQLAATTTDTDGRVRFDADLQPGDHAITFDTRSWFEEQGRETFYPSVTLGFTVAEGEHYHVALLLSPFSYTTYRGS